MQWLKVVSGQPKTQNPNEKRGDKNFKMNQKLHLKTHIHFNLLKIQSPLNSQKNFGCHMMIPRWQPKMDLIH